jgi:galactose mutarotase-like enzyme
MTPRPPAEDQRPAETTAATGDQWVIGHGHQRAVITEVGATLRSFTVADRPVIEGFGPTEWSHGGRGQVLAPWPNRLGDGRYAFEETDAQAPLNEPSRRNAIHGLVRWLPWRMAGRAQNRVSMACDLHPSPGYPFTLRLTIEYRLGRHGLVVVTDAENIGPTDLPFGLGFHPYLTVGAPTVDQVRLRVPCEQRLISDDRGLPTGSASVTATEFDFNQGRLIGVTRLDTCFTGLRRDPDGRARVELDHPDGHGGVTLWTDERFGYLMVYTGDTLEPELRRTAVAVEPMSCPPDALRSGTDLVVLRPGGRWSGSWGITPRTG